MAGTFSRRKLADYVARQLHDGADPAILATQITAYLVDSKRIGQLELLIRDIETALVKHYDVVTARITSARPLDASMRQLLIDFVREAEDAKQVVITSELVDERLLGGVIAETPNGVFDSSIRTALRQLRATTKE